MPFDPIVMNAGAGGAALAFDSFTDADSAVKVMPYGAVAFGPLDGPYTAVDATHGLPVQPQTGATWAVTGTFWQATQPVSAVALPLPAGASTSGNQVAANASLASIDGKLTACNTGAVVVSSSALPTGAATAAKQPALGTAGTAAADVITVQGIAGAVAVKVDGSGVTQPVSGTLTGITNVVHVDDNGSSLSVDDGGGSLTVDGTVAVSGSVAVTGTFWQATQPVSAASLPLPTGAATESTLSTLNGKVTACNTGAVTISAALPAGSNLVGKVGIDQTTPGTTNGVTPVPATAGGCAVYSVVSSGAANQDSAAVKGSAGQLYGYALFNTTASARYVKLYNKASGATSADTPVLRVLLPAGGGANMPVGDCGVAFGTGICLRITTGAADSDTGACSAGDVLANVIYK